MSDIGHSRYVDPAPATDEAAPGPSAGTVVLGTVKATSGQYQLLVSYLFEGRHFELTAPTTFAVPANCHGRQVALSFLEGDVTRPLALGLIHSSLFSWLDSPGTVPACAAEPAGANERSINIDGEKVVLTASQALELKCGDASITLTQDGKILIRGQYVQSRASGVNRILGGSVQVN